MCQKNLFFMIKYLYVVVIMRIIETDFILKKSINISKLGIKFRRINSKEKKQILDDLNKYLYNNPNLKKLKNMI